MALLAESLVEEWLNRQRFFTIRGVKRGVNEMDLLAVRRGEDDCVMGWHVEVQVSFRPVGYICKLTNEIARRSGVARTSAKHRTDEELQKCAAAWVESKFSSKHKHQTREKLWPGLHWSYHLVLGEVKDQKEEDLIGQMNVKIIPFHKILYTLCLSNQNELSGSAGGELAEVVRYFGEWRSSEVFGS